MNKYEDETAGLLIGLTQSTASLIPSKKQPKSGVKLCEHARKCLTEKSQLHKRPAAQVV